MPRRGRVARSRRDRPPRSWRPAARRRQRTCQRAERSRHHSSRASASGARRAAIPGAPLLASFTTRTAPRSGDTRTRSESPGFSPGEIREIDDIVVEHDRRDDDARAEARARPAERGSTSTRTRPSTRVMPVDAICDARCRITNIGSPIVFETESPCPAYRVIFVREAEGVADDPPRQIGIARGRHEHEIAPECSTAHRPRGIHRRAKSIVGAEQRERSAARQQLGRGSGREELLGVEAEELFLRVDV